MDQPEPARRPAVIAAAGSLSTRSPDGRSDRYGVPALTGAWLADRSAHTRTAYVRDLGHYLAWCQADGLDPVAARPADVARYQATLRGRPLAPASVHRALSAISSWYRYLLANHATTTNPVTGVRRPRVDRDASRTTGLTVEEVRALLRHADHTAGVRAAAADRDPRAYHQRRYLVALRDRALVRLLADLGLRVGEALALDVTALSYNRGRRTIRYLAKGATARERPLSAHVLEALDDYLATRARITAGPPAGALFATTAAAGGPAGRLDEPAAFRLLRRLARGAGLPAAERLSPHSLRHAFATNARELGIALEDVQDAMGHADARTTRRYDRARHALHRDPALRLGDQYAER